ncbi:hypothetical protein CDD83_6305 [Cordyceps sp. RAO-2017]|nr:hypothetical protein CDD83_6305 [Cordyceps sp. RAO-2017]
MRASQSMRRLVACPRRQQSRGGARETAGRSFPRPCRPNRNGPGPRSGHGPTLGRPSFETTFSGIGLGRDIKLFLILAVSLLGTVDTWLYCKALSAWWKGGGGGAVGEEA